MKNAPTLRCKGKQTADLLVLLQDRRQTVQRARRQAKNKGFFGRLVRNSAITSLLNFYSAKLHMFYSEGTFASLFAPSHKLDKAKENGFFGRMVKKLRLTDFFSLIRHNFAKNVEESRIVKGYRNILDLTFASPGKTFGVFFLSAGLYSLLGYFIRLYAVGNLPRTHADITAIIILLCFALVLLFSKKTFGRIIAESGILSFILFEVFGLWRYALEKETTPKNNFAAAFFAGLAFGAAGFFTSPTVALRFIFIAVLLGIIIYSPESGFLFTLAAIPFAGETALFFLLLSSLISYILKLFRGKRNLTFKSEDIPALFFAFIFAFAYPASPPVQAIVAVSSYFMAANLLRSEYFLKKAAFSLSLGLMINMIAQALFFIFSMTGKAFPSAPGVAAGLGVFGGFDIKSYIHYGDLMIVASLPFSCYLFSEKKRGIPLPLKLVFILTTVFNAFVSLSGEVWLFAALTLFIFLIYSTAKVFNVLFGFIVVMPAALQIRSYILLFNHTWQAGETVSQTQSLAPASSPIFNIKAFLFGRAGELSGNLYDSLMKNLGLFGLVMGLAVLVLLVLRSFTSSLYAKNQNIRKLCAVFVAGILAFFLLGFNLNTLESGNQIVLLWTLFGLVSATGNAVGPQTQYQ